MHLRGPRLDPGLGRQDGVRDGRRERHGAQRVQAAQQQFQAPKTPEP